MSAEPRVLAGLHAASDRQPPEAARNQVTRQALSPARVGSARLVDAQAGEAVMAMRQVDLDVQDDAVNLGSLEAAFGEILAAARQVSILAEEIAHSTREQQTVAEQTASGMEAISRTVEHTSSTIATMAEAANVSASTAESLKRVVASFQTV